MYKRIDWSSLSYSKEKISYEEATKGKEFEFLEECEREGTIRPKTVEKDYENKCVKLVI